MSKEAMPFCGYLRQSITTVEQMSWLATLYDPDKETTIVCLSGD